VDKREPLWGGPGGIPPPAFAVPLSPPKARAKLFSLFTMASFFKQLSEDMEKVIQTVEEGAKFMMGETAYLGEKKKNDAESLLDPTTTFYNDGDSDGGADELMMGDNFDGIDELDGGSPLMGMADSVLSDIMSMQVSVFGAKILLLLPTFLYTLCFLTTLLQSLRLVHKQ
jgi:hypothetical protein